MTDQDLKEIEERAALATPGPWVLWDGWGVSEGKSAVARIGPRGGERRGLMNPDGFDIYGPTADFEFIAHSRTDIPRLIEALREAQEQIRDAADLIDQYGRIDGDHHRSWLLQDALQILRKMTTNELENYLAETDWDRGIPP